MNLTSPPRFINNEWSLLLNFFECGEFFLIETHQHFILGTPRLEVLTITSLAHILKLIEIVASVV